MQFFDTFHIALSQLIIGTHLTDEELGNGYDGTNPTWAQIDRVLEANGLTRKDFKDRIVMVLDDQEGK